MRNLAPPRRPAHTLAEVVLVVTIIGLTTILGIRQLQLHLDQLAVHAAISESAIVVARARDEALAQRTPVSVRVDTAAGTLTLGARGERVATVALGHAHGVVLATSRDSIAFDVRGLGYGAANLTLVAKRGVAAETLVVSRLGRVRF